METRDMITWRGKDLTGLDPFTAWNLCHELDLVDTPVWRHQPSKPAASTLQLGLFPA
jgi:hypothetical protein